MHSLFQDPTRSHTASIWCVSLYSLVCACFCLSVLFEIFFSFEESWSSILHNVLQSAFEDFLGGTLVKNLPASAGDVRDTGSIPGLGRSPGEGHDNPLQYSCLENSMDRRSWGAIVYGIKKSWTRLSGYHFYPLQLLLLVLSVFAPYLLQISVLQVPFTKR